MLEELASEIGSAMSIENAIEFAAETSEPDVMPKPAIDPSQKVQPAKPDDWTAVFRQYREVNVGSVSWITLNDSRKYLNGAVLSNGYMIEDIQSTKVTLSRGSERVVVKLSD